MSDIGSLENPYVENPFAGRITNVHWRHRPGEAIGGTSVGGFGASFGNGPFSAMLGILDLLSEGQLSSDYVSVANNEAASAAVRASGTLETGQILRLTPFFDVSSDSPFGTPGLFYTGHPPGWPLGSYSISNSGVLFPFFPDAYIEFRGPCTWACTISFVARAFAFGAGISNVTGTIEVVVSV